MPPGVTAAPARPGRRKAQVSELFTLAEELFNEGTRKMAAGDADGAKDCFRKALGHDPDLAEAHTNLALILEDRGDLARAEEHFRRSIELKPERANGHLNLGVLLAAQKRFEEAEAAYRRALALTPRSPAVWSNLGVLQACRKEEKAAEESYRRALALDPDYRTASFNLSYLLLRQGRFEEGWRCLEARDWYAELERRIPCPRWRGETLSGRKILIGFEAGHGDMIQLCRFASVLKARGAALVAMICHPPLKRLLATVDGLDAAYAFDETIPETDWDFWTPPFSIPYHLRTRLETIPAKIPYLHADQTLCAHWSALLSGECAPGFLRVGLVWKGSRGFENDADRSLPSLATLEPLGLVAGVRFFSLQKGAGEDEAAAPPASLPLVDLGPQLTDFADTAAVVTGLDLVISVDTAVAHLAGALGKNCWLLLPDYKTDWRWLTNRTDSPWYPGVMRLLRQPSGGGWDEVVAELVEALQRLVLERRG